MNDTPKSTRRKFLRHSLTAAVAAPALAQSACTSSQQKKQAQAPYINFNDTFRWKMVTTWPPNFPILGEGCNMFAEWVKEMSGGRMEITVYGGGELVPALEVFDAVSNGAIELGHGAAYYWAGKIPAAQFFATVPFGMNAQQMNAWLVGGGGTELWQETYANYNLLPFPAGNTGMQMGGWFNQEINSPEDIQGLKMRIPGIGGKVFNRAGGTSVLVAGGEIYTNLERGVIDATEWIGPFHDYQMGFYDVARYYYYPGWHEPGTALELFANKEKFEALPSDIQAILITCVQRLNMWSFAQSEVMNSQYAIKLRDEENVDFRKFPDEVLNVFRQHSEEVVNEMIENDAPSRKAYESYKKFQLQFNDYAQYNEKIYYSSFHPNV
ncbi:TRAP-type mannitol/chloroaromatic compound transport system substrate-binding protein [Catalinimonas alkaloidigena]|uniref:TRAP transporter substrate-binding protein n=1 Tax=Catalinimonas alkaloidigena TaxID=1075417 RepID=UPI002406D64D|nr:TRAP transporter substrate-binding protein [Catalinimonas alkaloidigena]MDF9800702.1 TRAP-type mannitol/chloroaromatic compound transport system substrate-binding protein [Catalinimonas alkaloidigena]